MKILISYITGVGNTVLFIPTLRLLRRSYPDAEIDILVRHQASKEILQQVNGSCRIFVFNPSTHPSFFQKIAFLRQLRRERYDVNITAFPSNRAEFNLLSFLIGAKRRIAPRYQVGYVETLGFLQNTLADTPVTYHDVEQNLSLLAKLGIDFSVAERKITFDLGAAHLEYAAKFLEQAGITANEPLIGFHPGCNPELGNVYKRWPARYFAELGDLLFQQFGVKIVVFGDHYETPLKEEIRHAMHAPVILPESTSLLNTAAILKMCKFFVTNDSGLMHIATAMQVPTVSLFGPSDPRRNAPYGEHHTVIRAALPCMPCNKYPHYQYGGSYIRCIYKGSQKAHCMQSIPVEEVYKTILRQYANFLQPTPNETTRKTS